MSCIVYIVSCKFAIYATCPLELTTFYMLGANLVNFVQDNTDLVILTMQGHDDPLELITNIQFVAFPSSNDP